MYIYIYIYRHTYIHAYIYTCIYIYIRIYIYIEREREKDIHNHYYTTILIIATINRFLQAAACVLRKSCRPSPRSCRRDTVAKADILYYNRW